MFTGVIQSIGQVKRVKKQQETIQLVIQVKEELLHGYQVGDSMAVNGVCLTATEVKVTEFTVDVMPETFRSTNLQFAFPGSHVNLERAMLATGRFEGHIVTGHVDTTVKVNRTWKEQNAFYMSFSLPNDYRDEIIAKGSVSLDGTSLTVVEKTTNSFSISLIPHSQEATFLSRKRVGDDVNLETDMLGKYILQAKGSKLTQSFLQEHGF